MTSSSSSLRRRLVHSLLHLLDRGSTASSTSPKSSRVRGRLSVASIVKSQLGVVRLRACSCGGDGGNDASDI